MLFQNQFWENMRLPFLDHMPHLNIRNERSTPAYEFTIYIRVWPGPVKNEKLDKSFLVKRFSKRDCLPIRNISFILASFFKWAKAS